MPGLHPLLVAVIEHLPADRYQVTGSGIVILSGDDTARPPSASARPPVVPDSGPST
jgi:hypothetical protein